MDRPNITVPEMSDGQLISSVRQCFFVLSDVHLTLDYVEQAEQNRIPKMTYALGAVIEKLDDVLWEMEARNAKLSDK